MCAAARTLTTRPPLHGQALENGELTPPHISICEERGNSVRTDFNSATCTPLPRSVGDKKKKNGSASFDAAASAMDKLFDFSEW